MKLRDFSQLLTLVLLLNLTKEEFILEEFKKLCENYKELYYLNKDEELFINESKNNI